jgi:large subunit ribosomal protein L10
MIREQKARAIDELQEAMTRCSSAILTDYQGINTTELTGLRRRLREKNIEYRVVKNTMARFAAERASKDFLVGSLEGPVAIAFGYGDVAEPARALSDYIRSSDSRISIKGGFLGDRLLTAEDVATLVSLPSWEILIARVLAGMQAPITNLVTCLTSPLRDLSGVLQARIKQLEGE